MKKTFTLFFASLLSFTSFSQSIGLNFDGVNDYVTIPDKAGVLTGGAFTFETWVKPTAGFVNLGPILHKANAAYTQALDVYFYDDGGNGSLEVDFYTSANADFLNYQLPASWVNAWHHLAVTYNGSSLQLFIDGVSVGSTPASGSLSVTGSVANLGRLDQFNPGNFAGILDEMRIWNTARTQAEIQASMNTEIPAATAGLTAYYRFNQGTINGNNTAITTVVDDVAGNSGTLVNFAKTGSISNFTYGFSSLTVLAIKETSFTATRKGAAVQLDWRNMATDKASLFAVERSGDGINFSLLANVAGRSAGTETAYSYTDYAPLSHTAYYRIKSTEVDGSTTYSKILVVANNKSVASLRVYPNPASSTVQLQVTEPKGKVLIEIKDLAGRRVQAVQIASDGTMKSTILDVSQLAKGVYTLTAGKEATLLIKQ